MWADGAQVSESGGGITSRVFNVLLWIQPWVVPYFSLLLIYYEVVSYISANEK